MSDKINQISEPEKDKVLVHLIKQIEEAEKNTNLSEEDKYINIILNVHGMIVSGELVLCNLSFRINGTPASCWQTPRKRCKSLV